MYYVANKKGELVKAIERREDVSDADKKRALKEYGDVTYADEKNKKYPLDTIEHIQAAARYWGMSKNRAKYSPEEQKIISKRIAAAKKKHGIGEIKKSRLVMLGDGTIIRKSIVSAHKRATKTGKIVPVKQYINKKTKKVKPEVKPAGIPKELEPLAEEARKYKSAKEFVDNFRMEDYQGEITPEVWLLHQSTFHRPNEKIYELSTGWAQNWVISQLEKAGFKKPELKTTYKEIKDFLKQKINASSLTDFYNQVVKGTRVEVKPEVKPEKAKIPIGTKLEHIKGGSAKIVSNPEKGLYQAEIITRDGEYIGRQWLSQKEINKYFKIPETKIPNNKKNKKMNKSLEFELTGEQIKSGILSKIPELKTKLTALREKSGVNQSSKTDEFSDVADVAVDVAEIPIAEKIPNIKYEIERLEQQIKELERIVRNIDPKKKFKLYSYELERYNL